MITYPDISMIPFLFVYVAVNCYFFASIGAFVLLGSYSIVHISYCFLLSTILLRLGSLSPLILTAHYYADVPCVVYDTFHFTRANSEMTTPVLCHAGPTIAFTANV